MSELEVIGPESLDLQAYARLQKEAYAEILQRADVAGEHMAADFYAWKYRPPAGPARIAVVYEQGEMVTVNGMFPVELRLGTHAVVGWQSCDTATVPAARGKGHSRRCFEALLSTLEADRVFFGFPNENSRPLVERLGLRVVDTVTTWVCPWALPPRDHSWGIQEVRRFGPEQDALAERLANRDRVSVLRSAAYLNWRYVDHPIHRYSCFSCARDGGAGGFLVMGEAYAKGRRIAVVMDLWGEGARTERRLLRHAARWAQGRGLRQLLLMDTAMRFDVAVSSGFVPVPAALLPKKQVLTAVATEGPTSNAMIEKGWRVQLGDWDAF